MRLFRPQNYATARSASAAASRRRLANAASDEECVCGVEEVGRGEVRVWGEGERESTGGKEAWGRMERRDGGGLIA
eukprot:gene9214-22514_t